AVGAAETALAAVSALDPAGTALAALRRLGGNDGDDIADAHRELDSEVGTPTAVGAIDLTAVAAAKADHDLADTGGNVPVRRLRELPELLRERSRVRGTGRPEAEAAERHGCS